MIDKLESKIKEYINIILQKDVREMTKEDYDVISYEYFKQKTMLDSYEQNNKLLETVCSVLSKK